ncbi:response regulator [Ferrovibrio sp.]|uniref:response regulator n=1 Tax=Ferrovibrio sp. TaxID=1917215 RepID=UPI001B697FBC|nr:response regulator [Ferrovibrio sp.]MBP7063901.1 response regulator [Ferrovibrio sp.]
MTKTVLTVDDSKTMLQMLQFALKQGGYTVIQGENGQEGLDLLEQHDVDVIISDINMPVMDGITFIKELRKLPKCKATPVLILTTESSQAKKAEGRAAGATGWIVKPFDPAKLLEVIRKVSP